ncbi:hypothetical protein EDD15DRAFT_111560 [Pisolithus albus]|nr:hypothetical protein EDD15DRAFT_111560 [Pisolithus albus]
MTVLEKSHRYHLIVLYFSIMILRVLRTSYARGHGAQPDSSSQAGIKCIQPNWVTTVSFLRNGYGCQRARHLRMCRRGPSTRSSRKPVDYVLSPSRQT